VTGPVPPPWLAGPLDTDPALLVPLGEQGQFSRGPIATAALGRALAGVGIGGYDRRIIDWLADLRCADLGPGLLLTVLSWLYRVRAAGAEHRAGAEQARLAGLLTGMADRAAEEWAAGPPTAEHVAQAAWYLAGIADAAEVVARGGADGITVRTQPGDRLGGDGERTR
jgi:hypothetical protein